MANKIIQLTDRNRQPVYPIAGAMAEDAIETEMIKDGAVTKDKISAISVFEGLLDGLGTRTEWSSTIDSNTKIKHTRNSGFIQFRCNFNSTSGYVVIVIYGEDSTTPKFGQQVSCGPQQGYNQDSAIFPIKTGWYYIVTTSNASAKVSFTSFTS